jgi:chemotaxis protein CheD
MTFKLINVGIADIKVTKSPNVLRTILGSCIGICLYDRKKQIAGISHIMLPTRKIDESNPKKYADTAIPILIDMMIEEGALFEDLTAKIIGGATMFKLPENSKIGKIGTNNAIKVKEILNLKKIKITSEDIGGDYGRTIDFYAKDGELKIKSLGREIKKI